MVYEEDGHVILNTQLLVQRIVEAKLQGQTVADWHIGSMRYWQSRSQLSVWKLEM